MIPTSSKRARAGRSAGAIAFGLVSLFAIVARTIQAAREGDSVFVQSTLVWSSVVAVVLGTLAAFLILRFWRAQGLVARVRLVEGSGGEAVPIRPNLEWADRMRERAVTRLPVFAACMSANASGLTFWSQRGGSPHRLCTIAWSEVRGVSVEERAGYPVLKIDIHSARPIWFMVAAKTLAGWRTLGEPGLAELVSRLDSVDGGLHAGRS